MIAIYGFLLGVSLVNLLLMRRHPASSASNIALAILIPARNESANLRRLLPLLVGQVDQVFVFDDESSDDTASVAQSHGVTVLRPREPLPHGWVGKNRACDQLARAAMEAFDGEWVVFLDADTEPHPGFGDAVKAMIAQRGRRYPVFTGMPRLAPGLGFEPAYLGWLPWLLLATNPYGLVSRSGMGHNMFLNGQFVVWNLGNYAQVLPHEAVKGQILEDVKIGRLLAKLKIKVDVWNVSGVLTTHMYRTTREAIDGMSKNMVEVAGSTVGTFLFAGALITVAWGWVFAGPDRWLALGLLLGSKLVTDRVVRYPLWTLPLTPITLTMGGITFIRSWWWKRSGRQAWKGRTYS